MSGKLKMPAMCRKLSAFSNSVNLPRSSFPIHLGDDQRVKLDNQLARKYDVQAAYEWQMTKNKNGPLFVLLDGPPYANGHAHLGHAVNKILKDIVLRYKIMTGHRVQFRPGWDCHGLPVELKALKSFPNLSLANDAQVRKAAAEIVHDSIDSQMQHFKSWAVLADWQRPYRTMDNDYMVDELALFVKLYKAGLIFRAFKPVYWSPTARTALAEAELEYNQCHCSEAVYFKFKLINFPKCSLASDANVWAVVWTTTPWTLPLNDAICYNSKFAYCLVTVEPERRGEDYYLIGLEATGRLQEAINKPLRVVSTFSAAVLENLLYVSSTNQELALPFYSAEHVREGQGSGLVHTAFAHGYEDYNVAVSNDRQVRSFVTEDGCYARELGPPLAGLSVLADGQRTFLLAMNRHVLARHDHVHAYPYDWRNKEPVIIRASQQWFLNTDERLKAVAEELLSSQVHVLPETMRQPLATTLSQRPLWCISRQRVWGVPIPVFYDRRTDEPVMDDRLMDYVIQLLTDQGVDCWWSLGVQDLPDKYKAMDLRRGNEVLDVWFDSGVAWLQLRGHKANLVLEGLDQVRGWFQSLLLTSVASGKSAPYDRVIIHGFVQDEQGAKMSKSTGNAVAPSLLTNGGELADESVKALGVDGLRLWVALNTNERQCSNVNLGPKSVTAVRKTLTQMRTVLRFLSGVLYDFDAKHHLCPYERLCTVDKYMLSLLADYLSAASACHNDYRVLNAMVNAVQFLNGDVSNFYCTIVKNRLYCSEARSPLRRAAQSTLHHVEKAYLQSVAPFMPYLVEEYNEHSALVERTIFESGWPAILDEWKNESVQSCTSALLSARSAFLAKHGAQKTFNQHLIITGNDQLLRSFNSLSPASDLLEMFRVGGVHFEQDDRVETPSFRLFPSKLLLCNRCRRYCRQKQEDRLCSNCERIVRNRAVA